MPSRFSRSEQLRWPRPLISPYGVLFVVPSLYAWLWLPQVERRAGWARDTLYGIGLAGPALAAVAVGTQLGLGLNTPLYLVSLRRSGSSRGRRSSS